MAPTPPGAAFDWLRRPWTPKSSRKAAHPNARFTTPARQCPVIDPAWEDPKGVPISAFLFGGRRGSVIPLVTEAFSWNHGVFLGSIMASETTAAAAGKVGQLRRDPFAMLPFCGYHMGDYLAHWVKLGAKADAQKLPRIYYVNWFRKDACNRFLWPGYGENGRVLKWIFERVSGKAEAVETPIGRLPSTGAMDLSGLELPQGNMAELLKVDTAGWKAEVPLIRDHFASFGANLPAALNEELASLEKRVNAAK
jgi:phosphoenolpyruvate carboxykinase (GTP)